MVWGFDLHMAEWGYLACGQHRALTTGKHQHQLDLKDVRETASAEGKIETMLPYPTHFGSIGAGVSR
jgi:hypothetical protein